MTSCTHTCHLYFCLGVHVVMGGEKTSCCFVCFTSHIHCGRSFELFPQGLSVVLFSCLHVCQSTLCQFACLQNASLPKPCLNVCQFVCLLQNTNFITFLKGTYTGRVDHRSLILLLHIAICRREIYTNLCIFYRRDY